jgi:hypothetical protein
MELKPTIWQLYIEDDKNLQHVVELLSEKIGLRSHVGFLPSGSLEPYPGRNSKRQVNRKLKERNFRKNTCAEEREAFLQDRCASLDESIRIIMGIKVIAAKIERWKRKISKEIVVSYSGDRLNLASGEQRLLYFPEKLVFWQAYLTITPSCQQNRLTLNPLNRLPLRKKS